MCVCVYVYLLPFFLCIMNVIDTNNATKNTRPNYDIKQGKKPLGSVKIILGFTAKHFYK